ncbi:MAG TPA: reverse transcriptase family protein [Acidimicrobiales bacterium]|nr:reverse transcriptase family protein [Acidimicrobiales bacterium]
MTRRPDPRGVAAAALAGALLAGEWEPSAMARRAQRSLADRRVWLRRVADLAVARYPERPADRPRELARFVARTDPFTRAFAERDRPPPRPRHWPPAPTEMGPTPWRVPPIPDLGRLATWLGVTDRHLAWFADRRSYERTARDARLVHHHRHWVRKSDGSLRLLEAPKRELKDLQRQVLHLVLDRIPAHPAVHGFRPGRSALTAAAPHAGRAVVIRLDLEAFFTSVTAGRVYGTFRLAGYPEPVAHALTGLCTTATPRAVLARAPRPAHDGQVDRRRRLLAHLAAPHLAQGAPTSPALANLAAHRLDRRLAGLARRLGATYTRYADDLVLSGDRGLAHRTDGVVDLVGRIVVEEGFRLHDGKTRVRTAAQRQVVTGLVVNAHPNVTRPEYDRLRAVLHDAARSGPAAANRDGHPDLRAHLLGRISWVAATNPGRGAKLARAFAAVDWGP